MITMPRRDGSLTLGEQLDTCLAENRYHWHTMTGVGALVHEWQRDFYNATHL
jgi:hypothetical protein